MGVTLNFVSKGRQADAECLLLDSGAQLHACPITYPGQKIPLPNPGIHTVSGARLPTQLHKEESLFCVKGMMVAPLSTAGVIDEVAQELQMPMDPQMLDNVEEPMPARSATLRDPGTPDQIVMGTAQSDTLSESALVQDAR